MEKQLGETSELESRMYNCTLIMNYANFMCALKGVGEPPRNTHGVMKKKPGSPQEHAHGDKMESESL